MKKTRIIAIILTFVMAFTLLAGCSNGSNDKKDDEKVVDTDAGSGEATDETDDSTTEAGDVEDDSSQYATRDTMNIDPEKYKGQTLTIWAWWDIDEDSAAAKPLFEEMTGATVEWVNIPWADYPAKLISGVSSGTGPDICFIGPEAIPSYVNKNILAPVSDYVDLSKPAFTKYSPQAEKVAEYFTIDGKRYALVEGSTGSNKLFYRKDILENAGLEDPYELFMNGEWTWDKWFELMEDVTQDVDGDGVNDIWGFDAWTGSSGFVNTNGASYVKDGKFTVNTPEMIEALEYHRKLKQPDYVWKPWEDGKDPQTNLIDGSTCFNYLAWWGFDGLKNEIGDNLGFVPFPKGPSATDDMADDFYPTVTGIAAYSASPELAGVWFEFTRTPNSEEEWVAKRQEQLEKEIAMFGSEEMVELAYAMGANSVVNTSSSYPGLNDIIGKIEGETEKTVTQAVNEYLAAGQAIIDEVNNAK